MTQRGRMLAVNGVELCVETRGPVGAPPVLMFSGSGSSMDWWPDGLLDAIAERGRRVVIFDYRDTGMSTTYPVGAPEYSGTDLITDGFGVLDALGLGQAHVLGLSMGGALAQVAALHAPERVTGLTLLSTSLADDSGRADLPGMEPTLRQFYETMVEPDWTNRDAVVDLLVEDAWAGAGLGEFDAAAARATAEAVWDRSHDVHASVNHQQLRDNADWPTDPTGITAPTTVLHGDLDPLFPLAHGRALADAIPGAELVVLDDQGHAAPGPRHWATVAAAVARQ